MGSKQTFCPHQEPSPALHRSNALNLTHTAGLMTPLCGTQGQTTIDSLSRRARENWGPRYRPTQATIRRELALGLPGPRRAFQLFPANQPSPRCLWSRPTTCAVGYPRIIGLRQLPWSGRFWMGREETMLRGTVHVGLDSFSPANHAGRTEHTDRRQETPG